MTTETLHTINPFYERVGKNYLERVQKEKQTKEESQQVSLQDKKPIQFLENFNQDDWLYVPTMNAFFAKERTIACRDWFTTNKELIKKGYQMPTPRETWDLIFYLKDNLDKPECQKVYDEILDTDGKTQVGEWQNFLVVENNAGIDSYKNSYCKRALGLDSKNNLIFSQKEAFANHVNSKGFVDIGFINPQGLPSLIDSNKKYIKGKNIYFNNSYMDDTSLVFVKHFNEVDLFFGNTSGIIGVRPIYKIPSEEDYQKQNKDFKQAISEIKKIVNKTDEVLSRLKKK